MKYLSKKTLYAIAGSALLIGSFLAGIYAQRSRTSPGFLQSTAINIRLGVWDKQGGHKSDRATFIVTDAKGKQYKAEKTDPLDEWVYVSFPDDFDPLVGDNGFALYSWKCVVDGKSVTSGKFKWGLGQADVESRNMK